MHARQIFLAAIVAISGLKIQFAIDHAENVKPVEFTAFKTAGNGFVTTLPAKSVVVLEVD